MEPPTSPPPYKFDPPNQMPMYPNIDQMPQPPPGFAVTVQPVVQAQPAPQQPQNIQVHVTAGGCPKCQNGVLTDNYCTCCGVLCCLLCAPTLLLGYICLYLCRNKKCSFCGATY